LSGNIYIPILPQLQEVFNCSATTINATVSVFMGVMAVAPLFWASWADFGGRKTLYLVSLLLFILANILLAAVPANIGALFVLRIVQALGASSVMSVGAGTIADMVPPKNRAKAISYFMMGPQLGPILGPILSVISTGGNWRWIFGFLAVLGGVVYFVILFFLPETLRCLVGDGEVLELKGWFVKPHFRQKKLISREQEKKYPKPPKPSLKGYWEIIQYEPVLLCSFNAGLLFAGFYGMSVTFSRRLGDDYGFSHLAQSFSYVCPGISLISGSLIGGRLSDHLRKRMIKKHPGKYVPEHRFTLQLIGLAISMAGLLGYGWCIDKHVHVVAVFVFTFLGGFGMTWVFVVTTTYLTECSSGQPATNVAIGNFFRNACAAVSSVLINVLIQKMGFGWCFTGLALVDLVGFAIVALLMVRGPKWRAQWDEKKS
jgi:multidrug resistance protein